MSIFALTPLEMTKEFEEEIARCSVGRAMIYTLLEST